MTTLAKLLVKLGIDASELERGLGDAQRSVMSASKSMRSLGKTLTTHVSLPLAAAGGAALKFATDFNAGMANVASLGEEAAAKIEQWKPMVQDVAIQVGKSTSDMTGGLYQVVSAFGATDDAIRILEINAKAAAAGLATTTDAINLTSAVTKAYGDTSAEAVQHVSDLALKTVQMGQTTFPELAASIGRVTPLASSLGMSMEELFAVMATGTGVTGSAAEVSTQLRGILQSLMAPTDSMAQLIQNLGYESGQAMLQELGLQGTLQAVMKAAQESGEPLQKYIGSIEGQTLALALAGPQAETFTQKLQAMQSAAGATEQAFLAQTQGVNQAGFAMAQLKTRLEVVAQRVGDALIPAFLQLLNASEPLIAGIERAANAFSNMDARTQTVIATIGAFVAAIGPALVVVGMIAPAISTGVGAISTFISILGTAGSAVAAFGGTLLAFLGPVGVIIAVVAALYLAWRTNFLGIRDITEQVWSWVQAFISNAMGAIGEVIFNALVSIVESVTGNHEYAVQVVTQAWENVQAVTETVWNAISTFISTISSVIQMTIETIWNAISPFLITTWEFIRSQAETIWNALSQIVQTILRGLAGVVTAIVQLMAGDVSGAMSTMRDTVTAVITGMKDAVIGLITGMAGNTKALIAGLAGNAIQFVGTMRDSVVYRISTMKRLVLDTISRMKSVGLTTISTLAGEVINRVGMMRDSVSYRVGVMKEKVLETIRKMKDAVLSVFGNLISAAGNAGGGFVDAFKNAIMGKLNEAYNAALNMVNKIRNLLPGSDAREGPLSDLTRSGMALSETFAQGILRGRRVLLRATQQMTGMVRASIGEINVNTSARVHGEIDTGALVPAVVGVSGGRSVSVVLQYQPTFSFADEREAAEKILPVLERALLKMQRREW